MPSPSIVGGVSRFVQETQATVTANIAASAASWRGSSQGPHQVFPLLAGHSYSARASGRWPLIQPTPGVSAARGTVDVWLDMGSGASTVLILHSVANPATAPFHTLGINASGQATGTLRDINGTTVAAWAATTHTAVIQGRPVHMQVAWDALAPIDGLRHVKVIVNDVAVPAASYTTNPVTPWAPFVPGYLSTGKHAAAFDGEMLLTQLATKVVI
jgi:hypothetical protein